MKKFEWKRCAALLLLLAVLPAAGFAVQQYNWYEVFVRSYQDSDGDGIGDLQGLIRRLPELQDMGYNGLWLMPVMPSPSYHKYDVMDYCAIDPEYGTMDDMRSLVAQAHEKGIAVIIDLPVNHTSTRHPWFEAACEAIRSGGSSPYTEYYHFSQSNGPACVPLGDTGWFYEEQFSGGGMPDLNLDSEAVREEIRSILAFWLQDVGVDGFRLDAVTSFYTGDTDANIAFLRWLKDSCEALKPGSYLVGECWSGLNTIAEYYASGVDSFFLFPASQAEGFIVSSLRGRSKHAEKFARNYQAVLDAIPDGVLAPFLCNHDTGRTLGSVQGRSNPRIAKFAEGVLNIMGGCVFTYYGEEIGMVGSGADPNKRLAMYWNDSDMTEQPPGVTAIEYPYPSYDAQREDPTSLLRYCKEANQLRLSVPALANGKTEFLQAEGDLLLMKRTDGEDVCLIAVNFSSADSIDCVLPAACDIVGALLVDDGFPVLSDDGLTVTLPSYGIVILTEK